MKSTSPTPKRISSVKSSMKSSVLSKQKLDFSQAMIEIVSGKKITKLEWKNKEIYGVLKDGILILHKEDGRDYQWIISEGDLAGDDFIIK